MPCLLRCRLTKYAVSPPGSGVPHARAMSPAPLGSSLITRAPKSASMVEQKGPARAWLRSMTVTSSSGRRMRLVSSPPMVAQRPYLLSLPSQPVTDGPAHDQLEGVGLQPRQLFREKGHALTPRARHARDVGAPEPARRAEGVVEAVQIVVDVAKRVRLIGVARRARRLHRDVGISREREHVRQIRPPLTRARVAPRATE